MARAHALHPVTGGEAKPNNNALRRRRASHLPPDTIAHAIACRTSLLITFGLLPRI